MWIVALDTRQAKARFHTFRIVYVGMCRDGTTLCRSAMARIAKFIDLSGGKKERGTGSRMRPMTSGTGIGQGGIVVVRISLRQRNPRQAKAQEQNNDQE